MKKNILFLLLLFSAIAFSQNIRFEGTVKDTTGVGLEMANIMAINQQTKAMDAYAITNEIKMDAEVVSEPEMEFE